MVFDDLRGGWAVFAAPWECETLSDSYKNMLQQVSRPYCWLCGRCANEQPTWWYVPFLIERAHIVWNPRAKDRRAVVLLCSLCHKVQHGERFQTDYPKITRANLLWLKWKYDRNYYDVGFLRCHSIQELPSRKIPHRKYRAEFTLRHGNKGVS
jgi:hypothetical protein